MEECNKKDYIYTIRQKIQYFLYNYHLDNPRYFEAISKVRPKSLKIHIYHTIINKFEWAGKNLFNET